MRDVAWAIIFLGSAIIFAAGAQTSAGLGHDACYIGGAIGVVSLVRVATIRTES